LRGSGYDRIPFLSGERRCDDGLLNSFEAPSNISSIGGSSFVGMFEGDVILEGGIDRDSCTDAFFRGGPIIPSLSLISRERFLL
jgi:hypothetical protein